MLVTLDIGGTNIRVALWKEGNIAKIEKFKTDQFDFEKSIDPVIFYLNKLESVDAIAIGMPGPADYQNGIFKNPTNLSGWWNRDLKTYIHTKTKIKKCFFENDANLMALANHKELGYTDKDITQFFTVSTGLGAGLIMGGKIYNGSSNSAQEIACLPVNSIDEDNRYSRGAVEWFSSGGGMEERAKKIIGNISTKELFELYGKGEARAIKIISEGYDSLGNLIAIATSLLNPTSIIFDGSVARKEPWFIHKAVEVAKTRVYMQQADTIKIHISNLGDNSTLIGAYHLVNEKLRESDSN